MIARRHWGAAGAGIRRWRDLGNWASLQRIADEPIQVQRWGARKNKGLERYTGTLRERIAGDRLYERR